MDSSRPGPPDKGDGHVAASLASYAGLVQWDWAGSFGLPHLDWERDDGM